MRHAVPFRQVFLIAAPHSALATKPLARYRRGSSSPEILLGKAIPRRQQFHLVVQLPFALQQLATECRGSLVRRLLKAIRLLGGK